VTASGTVYVSTVPVKLNVVTTESAYARSPITMPAATTIKEAHMAIAAASADSRRKPEAVSEFLTIAASRSSAS
jgi:hypothetical protein